MHYSDLVYRPPFEAHSLLLQVTRGCSHNKCSFCTMYRAEPFRAEPMEQIEEDLREARERWPHAERVFLENGDPFALSADRLIAIAEMIRRYLPRVQTIAMYASVQNIRNKSDEDLKRLRELGINELNIGVESGLDSALSLMNKGYTGEEALYELKRLKAVGIDWGANIIFGGAGAGHWEENARATAALLNETEPYLIFTGTIHADKGCPLYDQMQSGDFMEPTFGEYLDEEELLLHLLSLDRCLYFGLHPSNVAPMQGILQRDKADMLAEIQNCRKELAGHLNERPRRCGEGAIVWPG